MAKQIINIGQVANDKSGDPLRTAFNKINQNFSELYIGVNVLRTSLVNGNLAVALQTNGTLTTPLLIPTSFTAILDTAHMYPQPGIAFEGTYWQYRVEFQVTPNGIVETMMDQIFPQQSNPGYVSGHTFRFTEADHGIPNYNFDITLNNVVLPGGAGWTANTSVSIPPEFPATISSLGAIKINADSKSLVFGTNGKLTLPSGGDIVDSNGVSVLTPINIDGGDASSSF